MARARPRLRVARPAPARLPTLTFGLLVLALLACGLVGLLLINTLTAQDAIRLHNLQSGGAGLADQASELAAQVDRLSAPESLAARARALGLVPGGDPVFIQPDGRLLGATPTAVPVPSGSPVGGLLVGGTPQPAAVAAPIAPASRVPVTPAAKPRASPRPSTKPSSGHRRQQSPRGLSAKPPGRAATVSPGHLTAPSRVPSGAQP